MDLINKIGFITGGLDDRGVAITRAFFRCGLRGMTILDYDKSNSRIARQLLSEFGTERVLVIYVDLTKKTNVDKAFKSAIKKFKQLDIVINNANIYNAEDKNFETAVAINYTVPYDISVACMETYFPKYKSGCDGLVINMSSALALSPIPLAANFCATKSAVLTMGRGFGSDYHYNKHKTKFLTICPGVTIKSCGHTFKVSEEIEKHLTPFGCQTNDHLADMMVEILCNFINGDVFVCQNNQYFKVKFAEEITPGVEVY